MRRSSYARGSLRLDRSEVLCLKSLPPTESRWLASHLAGAYIQRQTPHANETCAANQLSRTHASHRNFPTRQASGASACPQIMVDLLSPCRPGASAFVGRGPGRWRERQLGRAVCVGPDRGFTSARGGQQREQRLLRRTLQRCGRLIGRRQWRGGHQHRRLEWAKLGAAGQRGQRSGLCHRHSRQRRLRRRRIYPSRRRGGGECGALGWNELVSRGQRHG